MTHLISTSCVADASCVPVCPTDAIHPRTDERQFAVTAMLYIDPVRCIDCGACRRACPIDAIRPDWDPAPQTEEQAQLNAAHFDPVESWQR